MISVVIPVSNDLKLKDCIDSLKEKAEVIISLNKPSEAVKQQVYYILKQQKEEDLYKNLKFIVCTIKEPSIAGAYNNGIKHATYDLIFLMDSDCVFQKRCIQKLKKNMEGKLLSKGKLVIMSNSFFTRVVAKAREYHSTDEINAYSPPLLFSKKIINYIGGYYFHPSLCWLEDSEFDKRVRNAGLKIAYDPTANVYHAPLSPFTDLRSAFWYGVGKRIGVKLGIHDKPTGVIGSIKKYAIYGSQAKGISVGMYLLVWKTALVTGYFSQVLFRLRK